MTLSPFGSDEREPSDILIFTKYPTPGYAKTRLIPAIGADRAADVSRRLTERVVRTVRDYLQCSSDSTTSRIYYASRSPQDSSLIQEWLGKRAAREELHAQSEGDLGHRLLSAFAESFGNGASKALVIGADIPEIDVALLAEAFERLNHSDLVIGPAADGGYYLLGMKSPHPFLFEGVPWSTEKVFATTIEKAIEAKLSVSELRVLRDVDLPEDLPYFEEIVTGADVSRSEHL